jgi:asparagine synthase (glutamine-hydrolysing)
MCGICGFMNLDGRPADRAIVERMNLALLHRGPDGGGAFVSGNVAIAMRRLAIIDVAGGQQPMSNEDGKVWIVFNGEIYNSPALTRQLEQQGHRFATRSDTETIVHQYEELGQECPTALHGMFAFALVDLRRNTGQGPALFLARDRVGIKPLFYYCDDRLLAFSSELTSLVQHPGIARTIDTVALQQYLAVGTVATPLTMFNNIRQLVAGGSLLVQGKRPQYRQYWQLPRGPAEKPPATAEAVAQTRQLLTDSVREHLLADVPVGAFLSGGLDSSAVVALMALAQGRKVSTFSIRFDDTELDESAFARQVAQRYDTDHHEFTVPNQSFDLDLIQAVITHHGQPTADSSAIPTFIVSRLAREHVKVVMSGDGGDECFAGYTHFGWAKQIESLYCLPRLARSLGVRTLRMAAALPGLGHSQLLRRTINAVQASLAERTLLPLEVLRLNNHVEVRELLAAEIDPRAHALEEELGQFLRECAASDAVGRAQRLAFRYYLPDGYLTKVDRMSMANAIEVRVPLLDHRLVENALSLPGNMHWRQGTGKWLMRQAIGDLLPTAIMTHKKQGFSIPLHRWVTPAYFKLTEELLNERAVRRRGFLNPTAVRHLLDRCRNSAGHCVSRESHFRLSHRLLMLVILELWCRCYLDDLITCPTETSRWEAQVRHRQSA